MNGWRKWFSDKRVLFRYIKEENDIIFINRCNGVCIIMLSKFGWLCMCMYVF